MFVLDEIKEVDRKTFSWKAGFWPEYLKSYYGTAGRNDVEINQPVCGDSIRTGCCVHYLFSF